MGTAPVEDGVRRRDRPARIGRDDIVDAAIEVGLDGFSMQAVADRLGVSSAALYSPVTGRDHITALAHERLRGRLAEVAPDHDRWDDWLRAFGREVRRQAPASAAGFLDELRAAGPGRVLTGEDGLALLIAADLTPEEAGYALWLVFRTAVDADHDRALAGYLGTTGDLLSPAPTGQLAATREVHAALTGTTTDPFTFDLDVIVAGIAARIDRHTRPAGPVSGPDPHREPS